MSSFIYQPSLTLAKKILENYGSPVFVTSKQHITHRVELFKRSFRKNSRFFYAMKANYNPSILKIIKEAGIDGIDAVSPYEVEMAHKVGFSYDDILFTGNYSSDEEIKAVHEKGVLLNLGSLSELKRFGRQFSKSDVSLRLNPGIGSGEFKGVVTGGEDSKFGINITDIEKAKEILKQHKLSLVGIHCHIGSGFYDVETFKTAVENILEVAKMFDSISFVDFGGGFGIRYRLDEPMINLEDFSKAIESSIENFQHHHKKKIEIRFEPGKFLVGESTCFLTRVTNIVSGKKMSFVGVDSGFNHIIRPAFYGAYHHIVNLSHPSNLVKVNVVGNICESSDYLGRGVSIGQPTEGDILAILTAGAYGASMSSIYNLRPYAKEVVVDEQEIVTLTRDKLSLSKLLDGLGFIS